MVRSRYVSLDITLFLISHSDGLRYYINGYKTLCHPQTWFVSPVGLTSIGSGGQENNNHLSTILHSIIKLHFCFCFAASSIENYCSFTSKPTPKPTQKSFCVFTLVWSQSRFPHRDQRMFPQVKKWLVLLWCGEHSVPQRRFILYHTHTYPGLRNLVLKIPQTAIHLNLYSIILT